MSKQGFYKMSLSRKKNNTRFHIPAQLDEAAYRRLYRQSLECEEDFWAEQARHLTWMKPFTRVKNTLFSADHVSIAWFEDGALNVSVNCIDRHLPARANQPALIWEADTPGSGAVITYQTLYEQVCRFAHTLKKLGVQKGDRVTIYMPMSPHAVYAMLACTRIGAVHSVVFGGFSPKALAGRIRDCCSDFIITADEGVRGGRLIPLKRNVDLALKESGDVRHVLVIRHTGGAIPFSAGRDLWYHEACADGEAQCAPEEMNAEDPLFILYTSGSTGAPKGVVHTTGGYLVYVATTHRTLFSLQEGDVYWCTADIGWITGHSYGVYGPLANGTTTLLFEGVPTYPAPTRLWEVVDRHQVSLFYTAPTVLRALMAFGNAGYKGTSRDSLRVLGSVGEPINPEVWEWYHSVIGKGRCSVIDTWWQTETGGVLISPLPGMEHMKPGAAMTPFFGIKPCILSEKGLPLEGPGTGVLALKDSWPGQMRTIYGDHERFIKTYFSAYPGYYFTGDGCRRDEDGHYWLTGRVDDIINVSGHRLGTAEIESALVTHSCVSEAAVVGSAHPVKGSGIYAFVQLMSGDHPSMSIEAELKHLVRKAIGAIAVPDRVQFVKNLPKTRSGKIMRRILRKIAEGSAEDIGDISTLAESESVQDIIDGFVPF